MTHPTYKSELSDWTKFRRTFAGGKDFVNQYLERFSHREDYADFRDRKRISYCAAHAKAAVLDIKNSIYQRMVDITRTNGSKSYMTAISGQDNGVDYTGNSMDGFIGRLILPELLSMAKVGIFIDKNEKPEGASRNDTKDLRPYVYMYTAEQIRSWTYNKNGELTALLLEDIGETIDEETGLTVGQVRTYRLLTLTANGVDVKIYDKSGKEIESMNLVLTQIPFVIAELSQSLLTDVADYQIALTNMASSDINYALKSNFPFYTEQFDIRAEMSHLRSAVVDAGSSNVDGEAASAAVAKKPELELGTGQGRRYPAGLDRPGFIHPSSEPLIASMKKQEQLKAEIRQLVNLSVSSLEPVHSSADSKKEDNKGLESGLSYIGMELQYAEERLATIWNEYESHKGATVVAYPSNYSLKTDKDRRDEAKENIDLIPNIPSIDYQKEIAKETITTMVGHKVTNEALEKMHKQIEDAKVIVIDPDILAQDIERGLVTVGTASVARLYPDDEAEKAKVEHAERIARIQAAQSDADARGVEDAGADPDGGKKEKEESRQTDFDDIIKGKTRGEGK